MKGNSSSSSYHSLLGVEIYPLISPSAGAGMASACATQANNSTTKLSTLKNQASRRNPTHPPEPIPEWREYQEEPMEVELDSRRLDSIARLITGGTTCAAVAYDGERLLIANNNNEPNEVAKSFFNFIAEVAQNKKTLSEMKKDQGFHDQMAKFIEEATNEYISRGNRREKDIGEFKQRITRDMLKVVSSVATDSTRPFPEEITNALITKQIGFITNSKQYVHAEMTMLDALVESPTKFNVRDEKVNKGNKPLYIGITKLCCRDCHDAIAAFNKTNKEIRQDSQSEITREDAIISLTERVEQVDDTRAQTEQVDARGTHMTKARKWETPNFFDRCDIIGLKKTSKFSVYERYSVKDKYNELKNNLRTKGLQRRQEADYSDSSPELSPDGSPSDTVAAIRKRLTSSTANSCNDKLSGGIGPPNHTPPTLKKDLSNKKYHGK
ncbi:MAG: nucleic acid/nucleotide deaminase domain-containing protein [Rickettsiales bacterium]|jgi:hypothetical protein|nr:nucleic acid/nucleotide deaminase domain-containing protein [Rickettsiales bacterium]